MCEECGTYFLKPKSCLFSTEKSGVRFLGVCAIKEEYGTCSLRSRSWLVCTEKSGCAYLGCAWLNRGIWYLFSEDQELAVLYTEKSGMRLFGVCAIKQRNTVPVL